AGEPHPAAVADPGGDVDLVALDLLRLAAAAAGRAGVVDAGPRPAAGAARLRDREQPLRSGLDAAAVADRADRRARARLGARAVAGRARRRQRHGDGDLGALHRLVEGDVDLGLQVAAALGLARARAAA